MDVRQLKYLISIIDGKSFAAAADEVHVAPSALGVQIRNLEEELGVSLLTRHARGVAPTAAGELLYQRAKDVLQLLERTRVELSQLQARDAVVRVTVGLSPPINDLLSADFLSRVRETHPEVVLSIVESPSQLLSTSVRARRMDLACVYDAPPDPEIVRTWLIDDEMVFIQPNADGEIVASSPVSLHEVARHPLVLPAPLHAAREILERHANEQRIRLNVVYELQTSAAVRELVQRGEAAALVPFATVARHAGDPLLRVRRLGAPSIKRPLWLIHPLRPAAPPAIVDSISSILTALLRERLGAGSAPEALVNRR